MSGTTRQTARRPEGDIDTSTEKGPFGKDTKPGPRRVTGGARNVITGWSHETA